MSNISDLSRSQLEELSISVQNEMKQRVSQIFSVHINLLTDQVMQKFHVLFGDIQKSIDGEIVKQLARMNGTDKKKIPTKLLSSEENEEFNMAQDLWGIAHVGDTRQDRITKNVYIRATRLLQKQLTYAIDHPETENNSWKLAFDKQAWNDRQIWAQRLNFSQKGWRR